MDEQTIVKIVAIVCITVLWVVNAFTFKVDGVLLTTTAGLIAGIAGYQIGRAMAKTPSEEEIAKLLEEEGGETGE